MRALTASARRPGAASARAASVAISFSRWLRISLKAAPSCRRMAASSATVSPKPATTAASAARRSSSFSSSSITSITPLRARMPSSRGGAASTRPSRLRMVASAAASTGSLTRTIGATPRRSAVSVP